MCYVNQETRLSGFRLESQDLSYNVSVDRFSWPQIKHIETDELVELSFHFHFSISWFKTKIYCYQYNLLDLVCSVEYYSYIY